MYVRIIIHTQVTHIQTRAVYTHGYVLEKPKQKVLRIPTKLKWDTHTCTGTRVSWSSNSSWGQDYS